MSKTWFKLYRGWQDHAMFRSDKDKLNWLWLIENAVVSKVIISINNSPVEIDRGQLCYSISYLAKAWGTTPSYVRTFLKHLKKWQAIDTQNDKGQTLITVCNYNKYQDTRTQNDKGIDRNLARGSQGHRNNKKNDKECIKNKEYNIGDATPPKTPKIKKPESVSDQTWQDFLAHRKTKKSNLTQTALNGIINQARIAQMPLEDVLAEMITRGWVGFKAEWINQSKGKQNGKTKSDIIAEQCQQIMDKYGDR